MKVFVAETMVTAAGKRVTEATQRRLGDRAKINGTGMAQNDKHRLPWYRSARSRMENNHANTKNGTAIRSGKGVATILRWLEVQPRGPKGL